MSKLAIRAVVLTGTSTNPHKHAVDGMWLQTYDPDAFDGQGDAVFTANIQEAKHFDSLNDAIKCYHTVSTVRPKREDGKPNRPLSAFTVTFDEVPEP